MAAHRYLDGSVSYVRSDQFLGLALVRYGAKLYWERVRSVPGFPESLVTDDRRVVYASEVHRCIPLPTPEEIGGMLGYRDLTALDREHKRIASEHGIVWSSELNPCRA